MLIIFGLDRCSVVSGTIICGVELQRARLEDEKSHFEEIGRLDELTRRELVNLRAPVRPFEVLLMSNTLNATVSIKRSEKERPISP